jgi:hypothetical protein
MSGSNVLSQFKAASKALFVQANQFLTLLRLGDESILEIVFAGNMVGRDFDVVAFREPGWTTRWRRWS